MRYELTNQRPSLVLILTRQGFHDNADTDFQRFKDILRISGHRRHAVLDFNQAVAVTDLGFFTANVFDHQLDKLLDNLLAHFVFSSCAGHFENIYGNGGCLCKQ